MKKLILMLLFFASLKSIGNTYYFSTLDGDDSRTSTEAQNPASPWKTINKLNSFFASLLPGDQVLFFIPIQVLLAVNREH